MYADAHVEVDLGGVAYVAYGLDHVQAHLNAAVRVVGSCHWQTADAIVTVAQQFDS